MTAPVIFRYALSIAPLLVPGNRITRAPGLGQDERVFYLKKWGHLLGWKMAAMFVIGINLFPYVIPVRERPQNPRAASTEVRSWYFSSPRYFEWLLWNLSVISSRNHYLTALYIHATVIQAATHSFISSTGCHKYSKRKIKSVWAVWICIIYVQTARFLWANITWFDEWLTEIGELLQDSLCHLQCMCHGILM